MRGAWIADLTGHYGTIEHANIWTQVQRYRLDRLYIDGRQATPEIVDAVHAHGAEVGVFWSYAWFPSVALVDVARMMDGVLTMLKVRTKQCAVQFDFENHDAPGFLTWLTEWRALRPTRATEWTLEPLQHGWFTRELVAAIEGDAHLTVIPQTFRGDMAQVAQDAVWRDLADYLPASSVKLCYDFAHGAPEAMDGFGFTLERLPLP